MRSNGNDLCLRDELGGAVPSHHRSRLGFFVETEAALQEEGHAGARIQTLDHRIVHPIVNQSEGVDAGRCVGNEEGAPLIRGGAGQILTAGDGMGLDDDMGKRSAAVTVENLAGNGAHDLGFGNGVRLLALNLDAFYIFSPHPWRPYAGGGLGINFIDVTEGVGEGRGLDVEAALHIVGGIEWGDLRAGFRRYLVEARLGVGDTPDLKLTAGIAF